MGDRVTRTLAARLGRALAARGLTLAVAESCTGGGLCAAITDVPGSSAYFVGGVVAYADESKVRDLDVSAELLASRGAVSEEVALAMAEGARRRFGADLGIGVTGIAGPGGGSPGKPAGTVFLALGSDEVRLSHRYRFPGGRIPVRRATVARALELLLVLAEGKGAGKR